VGSVSPIIKRRVDSSNPKSENVEAPKGSHFLETLARLKEKSATRLERPV
jgi:hypothetical protein